jgi:ketosteroid isomerase-like protein
MTYTSVLKSARLALACGALVFIPACNQPASEAVPISSPEDDLVMKMEVWTSAYVKRDTATVGQAVVDSILVHAVDGRHVWVTRQGLNQFLTETPEFSWDISSIDYVGHSDGKDVVVVRGQEKRSYADGRVFDEHLAEFFAWKGGRIVEVTQYSRKP